MVNITHEQAETEQLVQAGWMTAGASLQGQHWTVRQAASQMLLDGTSLGTPDLGTDPDRVAEVSVSEAQMGADDLAAPGVRPARLDRRATALDRKVFVCQL